MIFVLVYGGALLLLAAVFGASRALDRPVEWFTKDPTEILDGPAYVGVLTSVATILWSVAAASCLLAWISLGRGRRSPFLWSCLLLTVLLVDDVFRVHEIYYPMLFDLDAEGSVGAPQVAWRTAYAAAVLAYLWFFRGFVRRHGAILFFTGFGLLGLAAAVDVLMPEEVPFIREEASKFLAIVTWMLFYLRAAARTLAAAVRTSDEESEPEALPQGHAAAT
jgi:hypothetical protein